MAYKFSINDSFGSALISVLHPDGSKAVKDVDYSLWEGEHHRTQYWSYTEGGVSLKDAGIVLYIRRGHDIPLGGHIRAVELPGWLESLVMAHPKLMYERPECPEWYSSTVWEKIVDESVLYFKKLCPIETEHMLARWMQTKPKKRSHPDNDRSSFPYTHILVTSGIPEFMELFLDNSFILPANYHRIDNVPFLTRCQIHRYYETVSRHLYQDTVSRYVLKIYDQWLSIFYPKDREWLSILYPENRQTKKGKS